MVLAGTLVASLVPAVLAGPARSDACDVSSTGGLQVRSPYADLAPVAGAPAPGADPRTYELFVPPGLPAGPVPLLISIHGLAGNAVAHATQTQWQTLAASAGFIVAYPNGPLRWDTRAGSEDVAFIRDVVADVRAHRCIDAQRIYAVGHSYGAFMVERLACDAGDVFAAGAAYAGGDIEASAIGGPCNAGTGEAGAPPSPAGYEPVPLGMWHGTADQVVNYLDDLRSQVRWLQRYDCDTDPVSATAGPTPAFGPALAFGRCRADLRALPLPPLVFQALPNHNHGWPDGCGGTPAAAGAGVHGCTPDGTFPTTAEFDTVLWAFLSARVRPDPAPAQPAPPAVPPAAAYPAVPEQHSGVDNRAAVAITPARSGEGGVGHLRPGPDGLVPIGAHIDVATAGDPTGVGPSHPLCPTTAPGPSSQPAVGKRLLVTLGDGTPGGTSSAEATTVRDGTGARVDVRLPVPAASSSALAIRISYPGDELAMWFTCGLPRIFAKESVVVSGRATS